MQGPSGFDSGSHSPNGRAKGVYGGARIERKVFIVHRGAPKFAGVGEPAVSRDIARGGERFELVQ